MKAIISRKGFDSQYGRTPSPIMPDGAMLSMPIPEYSNDRFEDLYYKEWSYLDIWEDLRPRQQEFAIYCHLDPDIRPNARDRKIKGWKPIFGQAGAAQAHLENQGVAKGDLFLFFGWFRKTIEEDGYLRYEKDAPDIHALYGYLQVGEVVRGDDVMKYPWHPHAIEDAIDNNTMYVASRELMVDGKGLGLRGYGTFRYSDDIVLTMPGMSRSKWKLPDFFQDVNISYHNKDSFKPEGYFKSVDKGQEFVVSEDERVTKWALSIIESNIDD